MKKVFYPLLVVAALMVGGIVVFSLRPEAPVRIFGSNPASPTPLVNRTEIENYIFAWVPVDNLDNLQLIANFEEKLSASQVREKYNCKIVVNGGFYTTAGKPTGLFVSQSRTLQGWQQNALFNGVVSINDFATPRITRSVPQDHLQIALQTGPVLVENLTSQKLTLRADQEARRMVAFATGENKLYFLAVYSPQSAFAGPHLADLPSLLQSFASQTGMQIADAINLDGGTASAFITPETSLTEASPVGSFFCSSD